MEQLWLFLSKNTIQFYFDLEAFQVFLGTNTPDSEIAHSILFSTFRTFTTQVSPLTSLACSTAYVATHQWFKLHKNFFRKPTSKSCRQEVSFNQFTEVAPSTTVSSKQTWMVVDAVGGKIEKDKW